MKHVFMQFSRACIIHILRIRSHIERRKYGYLGYELRLSNMHSGKSPEKLTQSRILHVSNERFGSTTVHCSNSSHAV